MAIARLLKNAVSADLTRNVVRKGLAHLGSKRVKKKYEKRKKLKIWSG